MSFCLTGCSNSAEKELAMLLDAKKENADLLKESKDKMEHENEIDFAVDVYPHYGSDVDVALEAGYDVRHGLIGSGVYASHGYERSHKDGVGNTLCLLVAYCR